MDNNLKQKLVDLLKEEDFCQQFSEAKSKEEVINLLKNYDFDPESPEFKETIKELLATDGFNDFELSEEMLAMVAGGAFPAKALIAIGVIGAVAGGIIASTGIFSKDTSKNNPPSTTLVKKTKKTNKNRKVHSIDQQKNEHQEEKPTAPKSTTPIKAKRSEAQPNVAKIDDAKLRHDFIAQNFADQLPQENISEFEKAMNILKVLMNESDDHAKLQGELEQQALSIKLFNQNDSYNQKMAHLFDAFASYSGLETRIEFGQDLNHCFNVVKIDDNYYCADLAKNIEEVNQGYSTTVTNNDDYFLSSYQELQKVDPNYLVTDSAQDDWLRRNCTKDKLFVMKFSEKATPSSLKDAINNSSYLLYTDEELEQIREALPQDVKASQSDLEKAERIRDYIAGMADYTLGEKNVITLLKTTHGDCVPMAQLFETMGKMVGLEVNVEGSSNHAFNTVKVNGKWLALDVCWYTSISKKIAEATSDEKRARYERVRSGINLTNYQSFLDADAFMRETGMQKECHAHDLSYAGTDFRIARLQWLQENC